SSPARRRRPRGSPIRPPRFGCSANPRYRSKSCSIGWPIGLHAICLVSTSPRNSRFAMAAIEAPAVVDLTAADAARACALSDKVGWNQTADDWRFFIAHGRTLGLFAGRELIATAAALPYQGTFGWVSMVIVDPAWRRRGFARGLMDACIETLRR